MARLAVDGSELTLALNPMERLGAMHGSVRVPVANIAAVDVSNPVWGEIQGMRMPGTGLPGVIALGTWRYNGGKDFVAVYGRSGVVVTLTGSEWNRLLVSSRAPRRLCQEINSCR